jgi:hypothetical protein
VVEFEWLQKKKMVSIVSFRRFRFTYQKSNLVENVIDEVLHCAAVIRDLFHQYSCFAGVTMMADGDAWLR